MKKIIFHCSLICLLSVQAIAQEQFAKRFSISFNHESFNTALSKLTKTQTRLLIYSDSQKVKDSDPVNMGLKNVTFDEAMDSILAKQNIFKDYWIENRGKFRVLYLRDVRSDEPRYVNREKSNGTYFHIGDILPDSVYQTLNYSGNTIKFSQLNKKLIILDLWNVNCSGCIEGMLDLQELQREFKNDVQVVLVTKDDKMKVESLRRRVKIVNQTTLPFITGESSLGSRFDYIQVPTQVWIDQHGRVVYITKADIATKKYVQQFIAGKRLNIPELKDTIFAQNSQPLTSILQPLQKNAFGFSAYLAPHLTTKFWYGESFDYFSDTLKTITRARYTMNDLYRIAYSGTDENCWSDVRIRSSQSTLAKWRPDAITWKNYFDYELTLRSAGVTTSRFFELMRLQLDTYFNVRSYVQKRKILCYVLLRSGSKQVVKKSTVMSVPFLTRDSLIAKNSTLKSIIFTINRVRLDKVSPILDETGLKPDAIFDLNIGLDLENNLSTINKSLAKSGLMVKKENRTIDCIIISERLK